MTGRDAFGPMSLAAEAREAVQERPFLFEALRAGVVNYSAAARAIDLAEDEAAVATALRRYGQELPERASTDRQVTVTMQSGLVAASEDDGLLAVNGHAYATEDGDLTGVLATGDLDPTALRHALGRLETAGIVAVAAGVADGSLCVIVDRRDGPGSVQAIESALDAVPDPTV
jgi:hypothetical protein